MLLQFRFYPREDGFPVAITWLAEQTHRRIPGIVLAMPQPTPIGRVWRRHPYGGPQPSRQMRYSSVGCYHKVDGLHDCRCVHEWTACLVQASAQIMQRKQGRRLGQLFGAGPLLDAEQPYSRHSCQRREIAQGHRAMPVALVVRVALPGYANLE